MSRLCNYKKFVDRAPVDILDHPQVAAQPDHGEQVDRLLAADYPGALEDAQRTVDPVLEYLPVPGKQDLARLRFLFDDLADQAVDILDYLILPVPQGNLVGNLEKVSAGLRAFAIESAGSKAKLGDSPTPFRSACSSPARADAA
jgi:hypothetical protein